MCVREVRGAQPTFPSAESAPSRLGAVVGVAGSQRFAVKQCPQWHHPRKKEDSRSGDASGCWRGHGRMPPDLLPGRRPERCPLSIRPCGRSPPHTELAARPCNVGIAVRKKRMALVLRALGACDEVGCPQRAAWRRKCVWLSTAAVVIGPLCCVGEARYCPGKQSGSDRASARDFAIASLPRRFPRHALFALGQAL